MIKNILCGMALTMLVAEVFALAIGVSHLEASGMIYIRSDGSRARRMRYRPMEALTVNMQLSV